MRPRVWTIIFSSIVGLRLAAQSPPAWEFRAWKLGDTLTKAGEKGLFCHDDASLARVRSCFTDSDKIGTARVSILYLFLDRKLAALNIEFATEDWRVLSGGFEAKYGAPASRSTSTVENRMGAKFANELLVWSFGADTLQLERIGSNVTKGDARVLGARLRELVRVSDSAKKALAAKSMGRGG